MPWVLQSALLCKSPLLICYYYYRQIVLIGTNTTTLLQKGLLISGDKQTIKIALSCGHHKELKCFIQVRYTSSEEKSNKAIFIL